MLLSCASHFKKKVSASLYQKCETRVQTGIVDSQRLVLTVGLYICRALLGMHSFTECNTVSAFARKGKASALKLLVSDKDNAGNVNRIRRSMGLVSQLLKLCFT